MTKNHSAATFKAIEVIPGFSALINQMKEGTLIRSLSESTFYNYTRKLADICLHYNSMPDKLSEAQINQYLAATIENSRNYSKSEFKHLVFGLRLYFKIINRPNAIRLPLIKRDHTLPVVLNQKECTLLIHSIALLKHRLVIRLIYSAGLRYGELRNLTWSDLDVERMLIHIRKGKCRKDRYVPLSTSLLPDLLSFMEQTRGGGYLFSGEYDHTHIGAESIRRWIKKAAKIAGIDKSRISIHTLRHSYATHLLEMGVDIISIKELLGHSKIETTAIYLQVTQTNPVQKMSPLDRLCPIDPNINQDEIRQRIIELTTKYVHEKDNNPNQLKLFEE